MKILFLCGSLEPGRDGVGDYIQRLCWQVNKQGHTAVILALKDKYITAPVEGTADIGSVTFRVLRLPYTWKDSQRYKIAGEWARIFAPDWVSLHYVPYSYQKLGVPLLLASKLKEMGLATRWEIMVHEPYLAYPQQGAKNKLIQKLQIKSLQLIKRILRPAVFHTTIPHYKKMLERISIPAKTLGLFGNIAVVDPLNGVSPAENNNILVGVYFGAAPPLHEHQLFASQLNEFCRASRQQVKLVLCGRPGPTGDRFAATIKQTCDDGLCELSVVGKLPAEEISHLFNSANFGISRVPPRLVGKSGSAISMLEHGLPLWIPISESADDFSFLDFRQELCFKNLDDLGRFRKKGEAMERLPQIAAQLLADFSLS